MSADNGVYILETKDKQYRVKYISGIDDLYWDRMNSISSITPISPEVVRIFGGCKYTRDKGKACSIAYNMATDVMCKGYLEYGIQLIIVHKSWKQIIKESEIINNGNGC